MTQPILKLYTQPNCRFCDVLKGKLDEWGYKYQELNISTDIESRRLIIERGHTTVPQLYLNDTHVNDIDTFDLDKAYIDQKLYQAWSGQSDTHTTASSNLGNIYR